MWLKKSRKIDAMLILALAGILGSIMTGCDQDYPTASSNPSSSREAGAMTALDFPTGDGDVWTYTESGSGHTFTNRIHGTKNVGGFTVRIMECDSNIPVTHIGSIYGYPVQASMFTKDLDSYAEHGFELQIVSANYTFFQRDLPERVFWSFPIYAGKEWIVSESHTAPRLTYTRRVVSDNNILSVPAGDFADAYLVEETLLVGDMPGNAEIVSRYWLAPGVGIIKYEFTDPASGASKVYELSDFKLVR